MSARLLTALLASTVPRGRLRRVKVLQQSVYEFKELPVSDKDRTTALEYEWCSHGG